MPRTTGSFDLAFGALEARLWGAIRKEVTDLLAAERKRRGLDRPMTRFLWCPLPMRPGRRHAPQDRQLSAGRTAHRARSRRACAAIEPLCIHHLLQFVEERLGKASRHGSGKTDYSDHSTPAGAAAVRAMARNPTAPPVQHPRCADRTTARRMTRSRGQVRFEPELHGHRCKCVALSTGLCCQRAVMDGYDVCVSHGGKAIMAPTARTLELSRISDSVRS
jgi:hypothetical protein